MFESDTPNRPLEDNEYPDDDLTDDWQETDLVTCPNCQAEISEESVRCPICGDYVTLKSDLWQGKSWWWILVGLLGMAATIIALALL